MIVLQPMGMKANGMKKDWTLFIVDVKSGMPLGDLAIKYGFKDANSVRKRISELKKRGYDLGNFNLKQEQRRIDFCMDWNGHDLDDDEIMKKYRLKNRKHLSSRISRLRLSGYELRERPHHYRTSIHIVKDEPDEVQIDIPDSLRKSIIGSCNRGANISINAQLHDVSERTVKIVLMQYKQSNP